ncbi:MAG: glutamine--fructose-6-phosphate transaminase (isomerizing) [Propionibacteriaceae bacterium]|jgi:glucosamine--fructose-6-phosphate aminotransferase (isomerizing)|nr:glutamine--fructose-6-phosphate transaminase (isomerizing) [Propionibacteriaceae bacterium]
MCGIIGYVGQQDAVQVILEGLRRVEYRGYDSAGIAIAVDGKLAVAKRSGKLGSLAAQLAEHPLPSSGCGIGHTRWATHGGPNDTNAHPHVSADGRVALVHNGIIENFAELRAELELRGVTFISQTDTEAAAQLLALELALTNDLTVAMRTVCTRLKGAFTLVALDTQNPECLVAARRDSPLVVGVGDGENFVASDVASFIMHTREALELGQNQVVTLTRNSVQVSDFDGEPAEPQHFHVDWSPAAAEKAGFDWFMRKEIFEQPRAVFDTLLGRSDAAGRLLLDEIRIDTNELRLIDKIVVVACGSAYYAGLVAKYAIEHWIRVPVEVELASEFRYRDPIVNSRTLCVTISQSGETMDTLQAIRHARVQGAKVIAICNTVGATIARESDAVLYTRAGPEIAVASTKGFLTQVSAAYLLGLYLAQLRGTMFADEVERYLTELSEVPDKIQQVLDQAERVYALAADVVDTQDFIFLGRHVGSAVALEGALKLKEIAYLHAEGFAAGELKHGPIAIIDETTPVFVVVPPPGAGQLHDKVISNIQEVRARGARVVVLAERGDVAAGSCADYLLELPPTSVLLQPLTASVPLQLFACELATLLGNDVDQPRNLAKSVTVE